MDHWADNFFNAFICEVCAPIIVPLPFPVLVASRLFRICESLEKHSASRAVLMSCIRPSASCRSPRCRTTTTGTMKATVARVQLRRSAPLGGLWDVLFNSRHHGRSNGYAECAATRDDTASSASCRRSGQGHGLGPPADHAAAAPGVLSPGRCTARRTATSAFPPRAMAAYPRRHLGGHSRALGGRGKTTTQTITNSGLGTATARHAGPV